jgi:hypothetical protein
MDARPTLRADSAVIRTMGNGEFAFALEGVTGISSNPTSLK